MLYRKVPAGAVRPVIYDTIRNGGTSVASPVRKAVFPAAGLGTRFLPATKVQPKEMLPLVDKPIIQYGVEEAAAAGVEDIVIVTGRGKSAIEDHFDVSTELETFLDARGKGELAAEVRSIARLVRSVSYVRQGEPLGLGHAVLSARPLVGEEPFAVILADDVIDAAPSALAQMLDVYNEVDGPVILVERIPKAQISGYGVIAADLVRPGVYRITDLVEKPAPEDAPSDLAIIGRYVLTPDVFDALVDEAASVRSGEIQLTNGLKRLMGSRPLYACEVTGVRHDTGNKLGFLKASLYFALRRPDLAGPLREYFAALERR
jgi:UTP--glucose-1-phosphate uridylyltransferase